MINYSLCQSNTDKFRGGIVENGRIGFEGHNYQLLYKNFINDKTKSILEVGTANGGFAKFIKENNLNCFLVGSDIAPNAQHFHVADTTNYNHLYDDFYDGNSFSKEFITWIENKNYKFDLVIEDADHAIETQIFLINYADKLISEKGIYVCEDVATYENAKEIIKYVPKNLKKYSYIWDASFSIGRTDDICVVIDCR